MEDFNKDLIRRTDALNAVHDFFKIKLDEAMGDREAVPMGELRPVLEDNKELAGKIKAIPRFEALEKQASIERILERLEEESNFFCGEPMGTLQKTYYCKGIERAIWIIKKGLE